MHESYPTVSYSLRPVRTSHAPRTNKAMAGTSQKIPRSKNPVARHPAESASSGTFIWEKTKRRIKWRRPANERLHAECIAGAETEWRKRGPGGR
jgi:hypothetical protein